MKVESKFVIEGDIVTLEKQFNGIKVYKSSESNGGEYIKLYFTKGDKVIQTLVVEADCNQNEGFISGFDFIDAE